MSKKHFKLSLLALALSTPYAYAGDQPVNCREVVTGEVRIYEGYAECKTDSGEELSEYVSPTTFETTILTSWSDNLSCKADVPYSHTEYEYETKCDYTPQAKIHVDQNPQSSSGFNEVYLHSISTDRDGNIAFQKWYVDGEYVGNGKYYKTGTYRARTIHVRLEVTDNSGYTDSYERDVHMLPYTCDRTCHID